MSIDRDTLAELAEVLGPDGLRRVADAFAADVTRLTGALRAAEGAAAFAAAAHALAGAAGAVGATALAAACRTAMAGGPVSLDEIDRLGQAAMRALAAAVSPARRGDAQEGADDAAAGAQRAAERARDL